MLRPFGKTLEKRVEETVAFFRLTNDRPDADRFRAARPREYREQVGESAGEANGGPAPQPASRCKSSTRRRTVEPSQPGTEV